jgi:hypothetical protein
MNSYMISKYYTHLTRPISVERTADLGHLTDTKIISEVEFPVHNSYVRIHNQICEAIFEECQK